MPTENYYLDSDFLGERRLLAVYTPPEYDAAFQCPVVFCTDGQTVDALSQRLEGEITSGQLPNIILIGAHSTRHRQCEYTLARDESRFRLHEQFFTQELPKWVQTTVGVNAERKLTAVFGFSHGGAFALTMASRHKHLFGLGIPFSTAGSFEEYQTLEPLSEPGPRFYLSAGTKEKPLLKTMRKYGKKLKVLGADCVVTERHAGHDFGFWAEELPLAMKWGFNPDALQRSDEFPNNQIDVSPRG